MIDFNRMPFIYWNDVTKISFLQRHVIIHSLIYYELDSSVISDHEFDELSKQLVDIQKEVSRETLKKTQYYYCFYDFDGTTGFHLKDRLNEKDKPYLLGLADFILREYKTNLKGN